MALLPGKVRSNSARLCDMDRFVRARRCYEAKQQHAVDEFDVEVLAVVDVDAPCGAVRRLNGSYNSRAGASHGTDVEESRRLQFVDFVCVT